MELDHQACYRALSSRDSRFDGRIFVGVKTTGIFCRPICPARTPKPGNVLFYRTAAAAMENGFRPCLRCRPETAPDLGAWKGTSNTVTRALSMIEAGALDEGGIESLSDSLGVGPRQLRRLFQKHLGASPVTVAQTRRVLLAKQLIQDTDMPFAEVAFASGFGSIRRFNETFSKLYGRPPTSLRRAVKSGQKAVVSCMEDIRIKLSYRAPYEWDALLEYLQNRAISGVEMVSNDSYSRTIALGEDCGFIRVGPGIKNSLQLTVQFPRVSALPEIIARVRKIFDLSADPELIEEHLSEDRLLEKIVRKRPGLRVPGGWDGFELAVRTLLGEQDASDDARLAAAAIVRRYGRPLNAEYTGFPGLTHIFPSAGAFLIPDLQVAGKFVGQSSIIQCLAKAVVADPFLFSLRRTPEYIQALLKEIYGIDERNVLYILMRAMRESDAFPAGHQVSDNEGIYRRAGKWRPWRAYAMMHLEAASGL